MSTNDPSTKLVSSILTAAPIEGMMFPRGGTNFSSNTNDSSSSSTHKEKKDTLLNSKNKLPQKRMNEDSTPSTKFIQNKENKFLSSNRKKLKLSSSSASSSSTMSSSSSSSTMRKTDQYFQKKFSLENVYSESLMTLGLVKSIKELEVIIALPQGQLGTLSITEISEPFTELVEAFTSSNSQTNKDPIKGKDSNSTSPKSVPRLPNLKKIFRRGQLVCVKIVDMVANVRKNQFQIELTMLPSQLHTMIVSNQLKPNHVLQATVKSKEDHGYILDFGIQHTSGFLPFLTRTPSDASPSLSTSSNSIETPENILPSYREYTIGQPLLVRLNEKKGRVFEVTTVPLSNPFDFQTLSTWTFLNPPSFIPFKLPSIEKEIKPALQLELGERVKGTIVSHSMHGMMVQLKSGHIGLVPSHHMSDVNLTQPEKKFPLASSLTFRVLSIENKLRFALTCKKSLLQSELPIISSYDPSQLNSITHGVIFKVLDHGCVVQFFNNICAFVPLSQMSYEPLSSTDAFHRGQTVKCKITQIDVEKKRMRASFLVLAKEKIQKKNETPKLTPASAPSSSSSSSSSSSFSSSSSSSKEAASLPSPPPTTTHVMKTKKSELLRKTFDFSSLPNLFTIEKPSDLSLNVQVHGFVQNVRDKAGVFVALSPTVEGRIKITNLSNDFVKNWKSLVKVGDPITCRVLSIDQGQVELTCKEETSSKTSTSKSNKGEEEEEEEALESSLSFPNKLEEPPMSSSLVVSEVNLAQISSLSSSSIPPSLSGSSTQLTEVNTNHTTGSSELNGFTWSHTLTDSEDELSALPNHQDKDSTHDSNSSTLPTQTKDEDMDEMSEEEDVHMSKKKAQRLRRLEKEQEEQRVSEREASLLGAPQLASDFERLLVGSPNSSFLWIQYMAFYLKQGQLEKARTIAQRALDTIHYREEKEKLHIWVAWMNLEHQFGDELSLTNLLKKAIEYNDPKTIYFQLIHIYMTSNVNNEHQDDKIKSVFEVLIQKYKQSSKVWTRYVQFLLERQHIDQARELMQRSLLSLPKSKHIKTITQCAILEFKLGDPKRGRALFEGILSNYPRRVDLWSVYLDMEIKLNQLIFIRRLFDRVITLKWSPKKMKFFFKKYLEFEKSLGDVAQIEYVKKKAVEYVESINTTQPQ